MKRLAVYSILLLLLSGCATYSGQRSGYYEYLRPRIVQLALSMLGTPYHYGGSTPRGFDCSGLVQYSYEQNGFNLPRTSYTQFRAARPVMRRDLRPGDLVFFRTNSMTVSHVGIYIGNNQFVHAPGAGKTVQVTSLDDDYYRRRFVGAGTFL